MNSESITACLRIPPLAVEPVAPIIGGSCSLHFWRCPLLHPSAMRQDRWCLIALFATVPCCLRSAAA